MAPIRRLAAASGLPLPEEIGAALHQVLARRRDGYPAARWIGPDALHITLCFVGPVAPDRVESTVAAIGDVASRHAAFTVVLSGGGGRRDRGDDGVAWVGIGDGSDRIQLLSRELSDALAQERPPAGRI